MAVSVPWLLGLALHGAVFLCGIVCASALTVAQGEFGGQCLLYGTVSWNGTALVPRSFSHISLCYFVSAVSVVVALCCFAVLLYSCCADEPHRSRACLTFTLVMATVILLFLLISACILRTGMDVLCASIVHTKQLASCQEAEHKPWVFYSPSRFYSNLYSAQASAWVNMFLWCLLMAWLVIQQRREVPIPLLHRQDPEWSAETEAILGGHPRRS
ncbi:transmembrane protein 179B isoform X1 [Cygnus atratus]|uniref:transmembrane protein 179B isoform X1 n=1 Tax=Cygnus atratus TaxID=8868 RepID=UPI0015D60FF6|nr:transmembrane protein 179B isoform X1 [Cygnus atratus]